jgi:hypothetical protein
MAIQQVKDIWEKDKQKLINSMRDLDFYYFNEVEYTDKSKEILASFENMTAGDFTQSGWVQPFTYDYNEVVWDMYDSEEDDSIYNYKGRYYFDKDYSNRVYFQCGSSNFIEDSFGNEGLNGNLPSVGKLITLSGSVGPVGTFMIHKMRLINPYWNSVGALHQYPGEVWLKNVTDNAEYGVNYDMDWNVAGGTAQWSALQDAWTDSEITINNADFWGRDKMSPNE